MARVASIIVCDKGYLRHQRAWRQRVADEAGRRTVEVEGEVVVPVGLASTKAEIGARTLRPRILRLREEFLRPLEEGAVRVPSLGLGLEGDLDPAGPVREGGDHGDAHRLPPPRTAVISSQSDGRHT